MHTIKEQSKNNDEIPFSDLEKEWLAAKGSAKKEDKLIKKYDLRQLISDIRPGEIKLGFKNRLTNTKKKLTAAGLDEEGDLIFITNNPLKIIKPGKFKGGERPAGKGITKVEEQRNLSLASNALISESKDNIHQFCQQLKESDIDLSEFKRKDVIELYQETQTSE